MQYQHERIASDVVAGYEVSTVLIQGTYETMIFDDNGTGIDSERTRSLAQAYINHGKAMLKAESIPDPIDWKD